MLKELVQCTRVSRTFKPLCFQLLILPTVFNYTLGDYNSSSVTLHRAWINGTYAMDFTMQATSNVTFNVTPSTNGSYTPPSINIIKTSSGTAVVTATTVCNETSLEGLSTSQIFLPSNSANATVSSDLLNGTPKALFQIYVCLLTASKVLRLEAT